MFPIIIVSSSLFYVIQVGYGLERKSYENQFSYGTTNNVDGNSENQLRDSYGNILPTANFHTQISHDSYGKTSSYNNEGFTGNHAQRQYGSTVHAGGDEVSKPEIVPAYHQYPISAVNPVAKNPAPVQTVAVFVEKKVPYAIEKIVPEFIETYYPIKMEKLIPYPVFQPYPVHIPVYKNVFHRNKNRG